MILDEQEVKQRFTNSYVIQPYMKFKSEVQFYYIKDKFEYALKFQFIQKQLNIYQVNMK